MENIKTIITDSVRNVNRIIRRENGLGNDTFGYNVVTLLNLAWDIVIKEESKKGICDKKLINDNAASAIILNLLFEENLSFIPEKSLCLATAKEVLKNINILRMNDEYEDINDERVKELEKFINKYEEKLESNNLYDRSLLLKKALECVKNNFLSKVEVCYFNDISMLEEKLIKKLNENYTNFEKPKKSSNVTYKFVKCYGIVNETDYVAKQIVENKIPFEDCEVICDTSIYAPLISRSFKKREIDYSFTTSVNANKFNKIKLFKDIISWYDGGCKYEDLFVVTHNPIFAFKTKNEEGKEVMARASSAFLTGIDYGIGWGKDRYKDAKRSSYQEKYTETEYNKTFRTKCLNDFFKLADSISKNDSAIDIYNELFDFVENHTFKKNVENKYVSNSLFNLRRSISNSNIPFKNKNDLLEYLTNELDSLTYSEEEINNKVVINNIKSPIVLERKHTFIIGLSGKEYRPKIDDSPILCDDLLKLLYPNKDNRGNIILSEDSIKYSEDKLKKSIYTAVDQSVITLVSSVNDVTKDGSLVSTSAFFEKFRYEVGVDEKDVIKETSYYDIETKDVVVNSGWKFEPQEKNKTLEVTFSKSSLDSLLECPLKYHYEKDLGINKEEYKDYNPSVWLERNQRGTFLHSIFEKYANCKLKNKTITSDFDENSKEFKEAFDNAKKENEKIIAAPNDDIRDKEAEEIKNIAICYLKWLHNDLKNNGWIVIETEKEIEEDSIPLQLDADFKIKFKGSIDRIDKKECEDGTWVYRIVDYKTGKNVSVEDKLVETVQHNIYARYVNNKYGKVDNFTYQHIDALYKGENNFEAKIGIEDINLEVLKDNDKKLIHNAFVKNEYMIEKRHENKMKCVWCKYKNICLWDIKEEK